MTETTDVRLHWWVWAAWIAAALIYGSVAVAEAAARTECGGWGFGCEPVFVAMMAGWFSVPPLAVAGVLVAAVAKLVGRTAATWTAGLGTPALALAFWAWAGVL